MWNNGYLGSVYVVGFAHITDCLVFILATAYPTPQISVPSSPFLPPALALARCLVFARRQALVHNLATSVACLRLCPSLRFVFAIPRRLAAATLYPPFRRSLHHLSICLIYRRHRNVNCVPPRSSASPWHLLCSLRLVLASLVGSSSQDSRIAPASSPSHLYTPPSSSLSSPASVP